MNKSPKAQSIELFRFFFMLLLCLWHFYPSKPPYFYHGYLVVEFFFVLSGFLLYRSFCRRPQQSPLDYVVGRFRLFAPEYLFSLMLCIVVHTLHDCHFEMHLYDLLRSVMGTVCDVLMLQSVGVFNGVAGWHNNPMWYMSVLLVGGGIVYGLLYYNRKLALSVLMPIGCLWIFSYLLNNGDGHLEVWDINGVGLYAALLRGVADISLGVLSAAAADSHSLEPYRKYLRNPWLTSAALTIMVLMMFVWLPLDGYMLILTPIVLIALMDHEHPFNLCADSLVGKHPSLSKLGQLSWCMFVFHYIVVEVFDFFLPLSSISLVNMVMYLLAVIGVSLLWVNKVKPRICKKPL